MEKNMGKNDRIIRLVVGVLLLVVFFAVAGNSKYIFGLLGIILIATAGLNFCPLYKVLGIRTDKTKK